MSFTKTGFLHSKGEIKQITDSFKKREFVLYVENPQNDKYSDYIKFELTQDKCDLLAGMKKDEHITVHFDIQGRKYTKDNKTNYFNSLKAWKVEKVSSSTIPAPLTSAPPVTATSAPSAPPSMAGDDLPF